MGTAAPGSESALYVRGCRSRYRPATADQIVAAARQVVDQRVRRGASFKDPLVSRGYFREKLAGLEREVFAAVFLDTRHRLIESVELFQGTIDGAEVHPREVAKQALLHNAAAHPLEAGFGLGGCAFTGPRHRGRCQELGTRGARLDIGAYRRHRIDQRGIPNRRVRDDGANDGW